MARTRVARFVDEGALHHGLGRAATMVRTKDMVPLRTEGRPPLLPPHLSSADAKVGRPPLLPPCRPGTDAKVGRPPLLPPRMPGTNAKVGRPPLLPPYWLGADAKVGRPLKALVWFWIIDETLVLTSMLSV